MISQIRSPAGSDVYVRIACPVDVTVTSGGETLSSREDSENTRTSFGTLTYEDIKTDEQEEYDNNDKISYYDDEAEDDSGRVTMRRSCVWIWNRTMISTWKAMQAVR